MPAKTRTARAVDVADAVRELPAALAFAEDLEVDDSAPDAQKHAAWEHVEMLGATIHRQARRLAGKSRAG